MNGDFVTYRDGRSVNDVISELIQGGGGGVGCFIAEYGETTAQEIIDFLESIDNPIAPMLVERNGRFSTVITAQKMAENRVVIRIFEAINPGYYMITYTITDSRWAASNAGFQPLLVSGTNIKTVNGNTLLGSGDLSV